MNRLAPAAQYTIAALVGLYLAAGQPVAYAVATVTLALVATVASRRSNRSVAAADVSACRAEPIESVAVPSVVEHDLDGHVDDNLVGRALDNVRHHAGALV